MIRAFLQARNACHQTPFIDRLERLSRVSLVVSETNFVLLRTKSETGNETEIRIAVYEEKRFKALRIDPWSEKLNEARSQGMAFRVKRELGR